MNNKDKNARAREKLLSASEYLRLLLDQSRFKRSLLLAQSNRLLHDLATAINSSLAVENMGKLSPHTINSQLGSIQTQLIRTGAQLEHGGKFETIKSDLLVLISSFETSAKADLDREEKARTKQDKKQQEVGRKQDVAKQGKLKLRLQHLDKKAQELVKVKEAVAKIKGTDLESEELITWTAKEKDILEDMGAWHYEQEAIGKDDNLKSMHMVAAESEQEESQKKSKSARIKNKVVNFMADADSEDVKKGGMVESKAGAEGKGKERQRETKVTGNNSNSSNSKSNVGTKPVIRGKVESGAEGKGKDKETKKEKETKKAKPLASHHDNNSSSSSSNGNINGNDRQVAGQKRKRTAADHDELEHKAKKARLADKGTDKGKDKGKKKKI